MPAQLALLLNQEICKDFDEDLTGKDFKNFSAEFVKVYQDFEDEEQHLWVGAVSYFDTAF
ncbi:MAG: hypothetical protein DKM50_02820 [Candidatus Margulisiibacteriota bacterium]|nr:MAG: hypothetical protein A2X43_03405 [Candidatus Margulisbacteria bacterium GWD2_39_127]OGI06520.1 MAG: hypothetical protein A2X41_02530 [Candidatus Margulisbacteria bacterium GWE2_39_32]PZM83226.1 MAG: hypothetical protein DKM50_02820 [Candidatus Margulisiibacteriota bacterium]HAR62469.1 hypothetical protein [Candidatus Margulisiibacteriota bacterium]HCT86417.1 hypothetical protein [Candidatus Margulisiibacteriota bacterium]